MPTSSTKIQRARIAKNQTPKQRANAKAFRSRHSINNLWQMNWIGNLPYPELCKIYKIKP